MSDTMIFLVAASPAIGTILLVGSFYVALRFASKLDQWRKKREAPRG